MTELVDQRGRPVRLGQKLGTGGEGAVYEIAGVSQFVAKVYHVAPEPSKADKLNAMVAIATANKRLLDVAAWPVATLYDRPGGSVVGIGMPRVTGGREIHDLYGPSFRKIHFPNADWRFLLGVARRCVAAFDDIHRGGIVVGDVNQGNVLVFPDGRIRLIDCDSFQIAHGGRTFLCGVAVGHFTPPELQSADFRSVIRTPNHDRFGLAVLIFHLLFAGRHPFAGRFLGAGDPPPIEKAIVEGRFAYASWAARAQMAPPPHVPTLRVVPSEIGTLFERAFGPGSELAGARPSAAEWAAAIERLGRSLRRCSESPGHFYPAHLSACPWCEIERHGGPDYFISVTIKAFAAGRTFDFSRFWIEIEALQAAALRNDPGELLPLPAPPAWSPALPVAVPAASRRVPKPVPLPAGIADGRGLQGIVGIVFIATVFGVPLSLIAPFWTPVVAGLALLFGGWWGSLVMTSPLWRLRRERVSVVSRARRKRAQVEATHRAAQARLDEATGAVVTAAEVRRWAEQKVRAAVTDRWRAVLAEQSGCYRDLCQAKQTYLLLAEEKQAAIRQLEDTAKEREVDEFLKSKFIRDAGLSGIGPVKLATLAAHGVETAYDVATHRWDLYKIPGFGPATIETLVSWRKQIVASRIFFGKAPKSDLDAVEAKFTQRRFLMERHLQEQARKLKQLAAATAAAAIKRTVVDDSTYRRAVAVEIEVIAAEAKAAEGQARAARAEGEAIAAEARVVAEAGALPTVLEVMFPTRLGSRPSKDF